MKKLLIVYYSWSNGNTKRIAEMLQKETNADIKRIETLEPYEGSYDDVVEQGHREVNKGFLPKINLDVDLDAYDVIAIGTPTWWYTMAPAVKTFLTSQEWKEKKIVLFMTNGGWPGHVIQDMKKACTGAECISSIEIRFDSNGKDHLETPIHEINGWIRNVKVKIEL